jgi:hypothetical protein
MGMTDSMVAARQQGKTIKEKNMSMNAKMSVVVLATKKVLFSGTQHQCEFFIEEYSHRIVADCPMGTSFYVR